MIRNIFLLALLLFGLSLNQSVVQSDSTIVQIETNDGNTFVGKIVEENDTFIKVATDKFGTVTIARSDIRSQRDIRPAELRAGAVWSENPQPSRYFWSPNGYGLRRGEGYYQNVWVLFNQVSVGVTDRFSVGAGIVPLFLFAGSPTPVWFTAKVSIPVRPEKFNVGVGSLFGGILGEDGGTFGLLYGVTTFGNRDKNLNLGLGYGFSDGTFAQSPTITVGGMVRTGKKGYFISDNYVIGVDDEVVVLISGGGRRMFSNVGLDYGLFIPFASGMDSFVAIPWLGVTINFGNRSPK